MAHKEGLTWLSRRTNQLRYSVNNQDQWLIPTSVFISDTASAPALSAALAILLMSVTFGESFAMTVSAVDLRTAFMIS